MASHIEQHFRFRISFAASLTISSGGLDLSCGFGALTTHQANIVINAQEHGLQDACKFPKHKFSYTEQDSGLPTTLQPGSLIELVFSTALA
eukprot:3882421-Amphidinium_carterae.2